MQRQYLIQVLVSEKSWPLLHSWSKEEQIAQVLGQELNKTGKILYDIGNVLLLPVFSTSFARSSIVKVKPINTPHALTVGPDSLS